MMPPKGALPFYQKEIATGATQITDADRATRRASWLRLLAAAVVVGALIIPETSRPLAWTIGVIGFICFVIGVRWNRASSARALLWRRRTAAANAGVARIERRWQEMSSLRGPPLPSDARGWLATDLAVLGEHSLYRLMDVTHPALGGLRVMSWMLDDPAPIEIIHARQESVGDLRDRHELLLTAATLSRSSEGSVSSRGLVAFAAWCRTAEGAHGSLGIAAKACAILLAIALAFGLAGDPRVAVTLGTPVLFVQLLLSIRARLILQRTLVGLEAAVTQIRGVSALMSLLQSSDDLRGRIGLVQSRLRTHGASAAFARLANLLAWNETRYSPAGHWAMNLGAAFDVHLLGAFDTWRARHASRACEWLDDIADAEALIALATVGAEHPEWVLPTLVGEGSVRLDARRLVHPLLAPDIAIPNDIALHTSDVIVISGPNMAGKTTFLRAVGLNVVLAQAGGVVAADSMQLQLSRLRTSVRIEDDLSHGVSLFLAELTRLRDIIRDARVPGDLPVLFLFDEVLHGTNAGDRRTATQRVLTELRKAGAVGMVTTHDPAIGDPAVVRHLHFDGTTGRDAAGEIDLRFDYSAKEGPATHANALAILEMLGISSA